MNKAYYIMTEFCYTLDLFHPKGSIIVYDAHSENSYICIRTNNAGNNRIGFKNGNLEQKLH